jgi:hypothetical protein
METIEGVRTEPVAGTPIDSDPAHRLVAPEKAKPEKKKPGMVSPAERAPESPAKPEPKGPVVKIYGSSESGDVVRVHGLVANERRVVHLHRQELERHGGDDEARRLAVAEHLARVTPEEMEPVLGDPWKLRSQVRLP